MTAILIKFISRFLDPSWLTGPIFDKELRVSSRRRRNYVLRFVYLAALTILLTLIWLESVGTSGNAVYTVSRMSEAGRGITVFIVWFQFCITQIVAVIMLSTSISDEIYSRTLGVLMTTPVNSFQIVIGKLFSKLLQLLLLLGISLPLLGIVRVFGGVPWDYLFSSVCITLTTLIFLGSMSLFFSIFSRRAYIVIIFTFLTAGLLFAIIPFLVFLLWHIVGAKDIISENNLLTLFFHLNPYMALVFITDKMMSPRNGAGMLNLYWPLHCGIMLIGSALMLASSIIKVRKTALEQIAGDIRQIRKRVGKEGVEWQKYPLPLRRVKGPAVLWKEMRLPLLGRRKILLSAAIFIGIGLLLLSCLICGLENAFDHKETHMGYVIVLSGLGLLFNIVLPATSITSEKESRAWPLLLATTVDDGQILVAKFIGAVRRCLPAWIPLVSYLVIFSSIGVIRPIAILHVSMVTIWITIFFCCTGIYFSSRFRHSTTAVVMNFALAGTIWAIIPLLGIMISEIGRGGSNFMEFYVNVIPFVQLVVITEGATGRSSIYSWPAIHNLSVTDSTLFILFLMVQYILVGVLFAWRAKSLFRRKIF